MPNGLAGDRSLERWLPFLPMVAPGSLRLFCFPHAGGGASSFRKWLDAPAPGVEVHPVQLPGRETRYDDALPTDTSALVAELAEAILPILDMPFAFVGNSMGSLIAYELARLLQLRFRISPVRLFAAAMYPPADVQYIQRISHLPDQEFSRSIQQLYDGVPRVIADNPRFLAAFLPVLKGDMRLLEAYRWNPGPRLSCPVTAVVGQADPSLTLSAARGWAAVTDGSFDEIAVPGGHLALLDHCDLVLERLARPQFPSSGQEATAEGGTRV
jgi:medium-chain acyl-[acyl-carrier-protein] hydrolase